MGEVLRTKVLIVGSGGNGISPAVLLDEAGEHDFVIITKHDDFGGVWHQNTYPGCAVDGPSVVYQFSYSLNPDWSRQFAMQPELAAYMRRVAGERGLYERTHFNTEMLGAEWIEDEVCWSVRTTRGDYLADHLVLATGFLEEAVTPRILGMESFRGRIFHSSAWPEGYTGEGDRVAVVGTGSSAVQIVPAMQQVASKVTLYQRTPTWVIPKNDQPYSAEEVASFHADPEIVERRRREAFAVGERNWTGVFLGADQSVSDAWLGMATEWLEEQVPDSDLRALLMPNHQLACKRPLTSDTFYSSLLEDNVELVAEAAIEIGEGTIKSATGRIEQVDTIVLATGFFFGGHILDTVRRRDGRTIGEAHLGHPRAYKSISTAGCPNLYLIGGPAPNGQNWNGLSCGETGGAYLVKAIAHMREHGVLAYEVDAQAEEGWKAATDALLDLGPVVSGGCVNYSQDDQGHNKAAWPGSQTHMQDALAEFDVDAYHVVARDPAFGLVAEGAR